jgi:hypothetical protein
MMLTSILIPQQASIRELADVHLRLDSSLSKQDKVMVALVCEKVLADFTSALHTFLVALLWRQGRCILFCSVTKRIGSH